MELSTADKEEVCESFIKLTGVNKQQAKFFLESSNYNFELAVRQFYENNEDSSVLEGNTESTTHVKTMSEGDPNTNNENPKVNSTTRDSNIATLSSIKDDRDPGRQAFYAGGSEHSGQQVLGPQKPNEDSEHIVSEMFRQAREYAVSEDDLSKPTKPTFFGFGSTLGSATESSKKVFSGTPATITGPNSDDSYRQTILKLWLDGFSIDDGPLRPYQDPSNVEFLNSIRTGQIPRELSRDGRSEVHLKMEDHRTERYQLPPKKPAKPFTGEGQRLGNPASEIISQGPSPKCDDDPASREQALSNANAFLKFDNTQPHTRIQIRLVDGSRLIPQINTDRQISDLRQFICLARPEYGALQFDLMTTFPNKIIEDESLTIKDSGLSNSSIVQRIKNID